MGYNPTDDGFVLAQSRRILDGQVPHRDFISVRPIASALLHAPSVFFGGDRTFWLSRCFVWLEFSGIAWAWVLLTQRTLGRPFRTLELPLLYAIGFILTAHNFPLMAWHSVDAVFLVSLGLLCATRPQSRWKWLGYGLMGIAYLCRQNFALVALIAPFVLGDWRRFGPWLAVVAPGALYLAVLAMHGCVDDFIAQLGAGSMEDVVFLGFWRLITEPLVVVGGAIGAATMRFCQARAPADSPSARRSLLGLGGMASLYLIVGLLGWALSTSPRTFLWGTAGLFGFHAGAMLYFAFTRRLEILPVGVVAGLVAWSASISYGYNHPALMAGPLAVLALGYGLREMGDARWRGLSWMHLALVVFLIFSFVEARQTFIYRDRAAVNLNHSLGGLLPGGKGLYTNARTHALFADLKVAVAKVKHYEYVIVPDFPGYWVKSERPNPSSAVWLNAQDIGYAGLGEIGTEHAFERLVAEFGASRVKGRWIVSKFRTDVVRGGWVPLKPSSRLHRFDMVGYVRKHFELVDETRYFEIYR
jgi:hypothetical protein